jgi:hypothetical protein
VGNTVFSNVTNLVIDCVTGGTIIGNSLGDAFGNNGFGFCEASGISYKFNPDGVHVQILTVGIPTLLFRDRLTW